MRVEIDQEKCEGSARCYNLYTTVFTEGADRRGEVIGDGELADETQIMDAVSAANACPRGAILLIE